MKWLRTLMCFILTAGATAPVTTYAQTRVEQTAPAATHYTGTASITYIGKWHLGEITRNWSDGTAAVSIWGPAASPSPSDANVPAARVTLNFSGTGVSWIGARGPQLGIANVFLDGNFVATVDTYAAQEEIQAVLGTLSGLADGPHTLAIEVTGTRNPSSTDFGVVVDAFDIEGSPSGRIQETGSAAVAYFGIWILGDVTRPGVSGGTFSYSYAENAPGIVPMSTPEGGISMRVTTRAVFTFRGTQVTWIGLKSPGAGVARVYLDGVFMAEVDTFAPVEETQAPVFTSNVLAAGIHTLAIEVTGTPPSHQNIAVDAFDVTP